MKPLFTLLFFLLLLPLHAQELDTIAPQRPWDEQLRETLYGLSLEAEDANYVAGICVYDLTDGIPLFNYNHHKVMRPASTQKILTAVSALDLLGSTYAFTTRAYLDGTVSEDGRTLTGNICVVGGFDPAFSYADLLDIAAAVQQTGIACIDGEIIADVSMKDTLQLGNGWCWDDVPSSIVPYLSPLIVNHGQRIDSRNTKCVPNPERYFIQTLVSVLAEKGVTFVSPNPVRVVSQPSTARRGQLIYAQTRTVEQILGQMMKKSDNLYAEALFFQLAARAKTASATWKDGARQVEKVLQKAGVPIEQVKVADGSGLSLYNYVTPEAEVAMLRYAFQRPAIYNAFYPSLPIAGFDGTLEKRMTSGPASGNVRAKTGTVTGVSSLAGYVRASNGHMLAFSIILNGVLKNSVGHNLQDRICQELAQ